MPMNPNFLCCIGAELKNSTQQTTRMSQVYLYRAFEGDTLSDMLSVGFFNAAMGIIRQDDLLLLYSPNETTAKYTYARVSSVSSSGVVIEQINIDATGISVDTTGYSNLSGNNLQEILNNLDTTLTTINNTFVKIDGTSIMTGPLKMRSSVSFKCAIAPSWDGVGFYKLNDNDSLTLMASMETTDGLCPATNNTYNIGKASHKWKDAHIARVITSVINNGYDIAVPVTNSADTLALKSEVDTAANSGRMITDQGVWYAKMYSATVAPSAENGTNYADFSQTDGQGNPIIVIYERQNGAWVQSETITPPAEYDGYVPITSKIWDIVEQSGQQGGRVLWNHQSKDFTPYPQIISFEDAALTGTPTAPTLTVSSPNDQIVNKQSLEEALVNHRTGQSIDAEIVGTLTVADNGDVSGFTNSNYMTYPGNLYMTDASSFEMVFVFTMSSYTTGGNIIGGEFIYEHQIRLGISGSSLLHLQVNSGTQQISATGTTTLAGNTKYYVKVVYDGTDYTIYLSTDGATWNTEATMTATYLPGVVSKPYQLGRRNSSGHGIQTMHMSECYVKKNDILVWQGLDCPGLHQRASNLHEVIEFQMPTSSNNYTWYRKYADGWVEQGGYLDGSTSYKTTEFTLPIQMSDSHYTITSQTENLEGPATLNGQTSTGFCIYERVYVGGWFEHNFRGHWTVSGMAAS